MPHRINVVLEDELYREVKRVSKERKLNASQLVRDVLRRALRISSAEESGFKEGMTAGYRKVHEALAEALRK